MYKEIFASLAKDSNLYYKIKNEEEAKWFANTLFNHGYSNSRDGFIDSFNKGRDCLVLYNFSEGNKEYLLVKENGTLEAIGKVKYEPAKTVVNPTYDDLAPLFSDVDNSIKLYVDNSVKSDIEQEYDPVERPEHYNVFEREVIYVIKDLLDNNDNYSGFESYCIGNSLKYIFRAGLKGDFCEDLEKARYYINKILEGRKWKKI